MKRKDQKEKVIKWKTESRYSDTLESASSEQHFFLHIISEFEANVKILTSNKLPTKFYLYLENNKGRISQK